MRPTPETATKPMGLPVPPWEDDGIARHAQPRSSATPPRGRQAHSQPPLPPSPRPGPLAPDTILASFPRSVPGERPACIRVSMSEARERPIIHLRKWVQNTDPRRPWIATKEGVTIRVGEIDRTIEALEQAKTSLLRDVAARLDPGEKG